MSRIGQALIEWDWLEAGQRLPVQQHLLAPGRCDPGGAVVTLSPLDDYPVHQIPEVMRHVGTSDRNFYDRYYFNAFPLTGDAMLIVGLGQYPNLGVTDAFALLRRGTAHRVVRASRELGADRMNTQVGPFGVEVRRGPQAAARGARPERARAVVRPDLGGDHPAAGRTAALHPRAGTGGVRLQAHGADRAVDRLDHGRRRDARGDAGPVVGDQGPVLGHPAGRGARAAGHPVTQHGHVLLALRADAVRGPRDPVHRAGGRGRAAAARGSGPGLAGRDHRVPGPAGLRAGLRRRAPGTW